MQQNKMEGAQPFILITERTDMRTITLIPECFRTRSGICSAGLIMHRVQVELGDPKRRETV